MTAERTSILIEKLKSTKSVFGFDPLVPYIEDHTGLVNVECKVFSVEEIAFLESSSRALGFRIFTISAHASFVKITFVEA